MAVGVTSCSCLYIVIDALDECEEKSRSLFLAKFLYLVQPASLKGEMWRQRIKLIISGQPLINRVWKAGDERFSHFYIDMEKRPEGLVRDLQRFIDYKVEDLVVNTICSEAFGQQLKQELYALSENSFLWLSIVLEHLKQGLNYRDTDIQKVLKTIPANLKDSYTKHLPIEDVAFLRDETIVSEEVLTHLRSRYPAYDYVTQYWDHHYSQAELLADASTQQDAIKLTQPPLVLAAAHNHVEILARLLRHGSIDVNQADPSGHTALIQACRSGSYQCLKELLGDVRTDIKACDGNGRSALIHACMTSDALAVRELLREPLLDVHLCDRHGRNAMSYAAEKATLPIVRSLFHAQVSIAKEDANGRNAISWASNSSAATKDPDHYGKCVLEYLIEKCPDGVDSQDKDGWPPLAWAMERPGHLQAVRLLVEKGKADVNQRGGGGASGRDLGRSTLSWAATEGFTQIVEYLLGLPGLDKNATDGDGRSALSYAAANGMVRVVELLLRDSEVRVDLRDSNGRTAMDWARMYHHDAIVSLLLAH
ncbi:hypothetical protein DV735_g5798, partial [Chaetothyriales sp. CBS 134920]